MDLHPVPNWCYQVRGVEGSYILLRAFNVVSKVRYNCSEDISRLLLIRKKDGTRFDPPVPIKVG